jgi:hypothetical protein
VLLGFIGFLGAVLGLGLGLPDEPSARPEANRRPEDRDFFAPPATAGLIATMFVPGPRRLPSPEADPPTVPSPCTRSSDSPA